MRNLILLLAVVCTAFTTAAGEPNFSQLYNSINSSSTKPDQKVFELAMLGHDKLLKAGLLKNPDIITVIDVSLESNKKRLWVIDLKNKEVIHNTLVAHGRNTGEHVAQSFSNQVGSYQTSLGFYVTDLTYNGKHGLSLRLDGVEEGFNDKARERAIVVHGADYVSRQFIETHGRLGRSLGCPALPRAKSKAIINSISQGTCMFIYYPSKPYLESSPVLKSTIL